MNFQRGIEVGENDTLNVYDQKNGTGKMIAFSERFAYSDDQDEAAIGADKGAGGNMNFYGGIFEATTKRECRGAAIGGGGFGSGGRMIFYAGNYTINAIYGTSTGIGSCEEATGSTGAIAIYGGSVTAKSRFGGAAIGGKTAKTDLSIFTAARSTRLLTAIKQVRASAAAGERNRAIPSISAAVRSFHRALTARVSAAARAAVIIL